MAWSKEDDAANKEATAAAAATEAFDIGTKASNRSKKTSKPHGGKQLPSKPLGGKQSMSAKASQSEKELSAAETREKLCVVQTQNEKLLRLVDILVSASGISLSSLSVDISGLPISDSTTDDDNIAVVMATSTRTSSAKGSSVVALDNIVGVSDV